MGLRVFIIGARLCSELIGGPGPSFNLLPKRRAAPAPSAPRSCPRRPALVPSVPRTMPLGFGPRLRHCLETFRDCFGGAEGEYPEVLAALVHLEACVAEALPPGTRRLKRKRGRPAKQSVDKVRRLQSQLRWARRCKAKAQAALGAMVRAKDATKHNRINPRFVAKVALSYPSTCARLRWRMAGLGGPRRQRSVSHLHRSHSLCVCGGVQGHVRQAGVAGDRAACVVAARGAGAHPPLVYAALLHIHDEGSLRLRSSMEAEPGLPVRSRSSKVQQHVAMLHLPGHQPIRWLVELDALADKTAATLATSLEGVLRRRWDLPGPWASRGMLSRHGLSTAWWATARARTKPRRRSSWPHRPTRPCLAVCATS